MASCSDPGLAFEYAVKLGDDPPKAVADKGASILVALAWGTRCGVPLGDALSTLVKRRVEPNPVTRNLIGKERGWTKTVSMAAADLDAGVPLSEALSHVDRFLPPYVIPAVREGERRGRLSEVLDALSRQSSRRVIVYGRRVSALVFPLSVLGVSVLLGTGVLGFLHHLASELYMSASASLSGLLFASLRFLPLGLLLFFPSLAVLRALFKREPTFRAFVEFLVIWWPVFGRDLKRIAILDAVSSMSALVAAGAGLEDAARLAAKSSSSYWMRRRLERFSGYVSHGACWAAAWEGMELGFPFLDWLVRNAAIREEPLEAFSSIAAFLRGEISRFTLIFARGVEIAATLLNAAFVSFVAFFMMFVLRSLLLEGIHSAF